MKQWITLLAATAIFSSCTKQDLQQEEENLQQEIQVPGAAMRSSQEGAFVSGWEQYQQWSKTDDRNVSSSFSLTRKTAEVDSKVTEGGLVLTYSKVQSQEPSYITFAGPTVMPFYFLPESERVNQNRFYFSDESSQGKIKMTYSMPFTKENFPKIGGGVSLSDMKFQFVAMTKKFLEAHGVDAQTVRNFYTYDQVMQLVGN